MAKRKQKTDESQLISTNVGVLSGTRAPESFTRGAGIREYGSWIAAAANLNACGVGAIPLRLYARKRSTRKMLWPSRKVGTRRKAYLLGDARRTPGPATMRKALNVGDDFVEITSHPVLDLLYAVNSWMCGFDLMVQTELFKQLAGNAYWYKAMGPMGVQALWPLPPQHVWVIPDRGRYVGGYEYRPPNSGEAIRFDPEEIVHFRLPNPANQWYGMSNVQRCWLATLSNRARHEMDVAFYQNHARPDFVWIVKNTGAKTADLDEFTQSMEQKLRGHRKAGRHVAVSGDVDLRPMQFPPKDNPNATPTIEEIAAVFGVPVSMLMANDPNLASAETGYSWWREQTIAPLCRFTEDALNQNLLPDFDAEGDAYLCYDDPVPENEAADNDVRVKRVQFGLNTPNEMRAENGDEPSDDPMADRLLYNGQPLGTAASLIGGFGSQQQDGNPQDAPKEGPKANDSSEEAEKSIGAVVEKAVTRALEEHERRKAVTHKTIVLPDRAFKIPEMQLSEELRGDLACLHAKSCKQSDLLFRKGAYDDTARNAEDEKRLSEFIRSLDAIGRKQADAIVARMRGMGDNVRAILAAAQMEAQKSEWTRAIAQAARPYVGAQAQAGGDAGAAILGLPEFGFDFANPEVSRFIDRATAKLATGVNETTITRLRDLVGRGIDEGETVDQLARRVLDSGVTVDPARAEMIARTESARAYEQGQVEAWKQSGVVTGKTWLLAPDACEFCRAASREFNSKPVPLDQPFYAQGSTLVGVGGGSLSIDYSDIDGPPLHPGCRCSSLPVIGEA